MLKTALFGTVGYNSSALIYLFFGLCAFSTPWVVGKLSVKWTVFAGAIPYLLFALMTSLVLIVMGTTAGPRWDPTNYLVVGAYYGSSVLLGAAASPLRVGSGIYVRSRSFGYDAAREPGALAKNSLGVFAGVNNAAFGISSFAFASLIGVAVRAGVSYAALYGVCAVSIAVSLPLFASVPTTAAIARRRPLPGAGAGGKEADELPASTSGFAVCELLRRSRKLGWLLIPSISSSVQEAYFVGSFNADVIAPAVGLEWVGWLDAIMIVISAIISPIIGRLSDLHGRLPWYYAGLAINLGSLVFVAVVGADMSLTTVVVFSVLRGLAGSTRTVVRAIISEEFDDRDATAAFSANTVVGMMASGAFFAISPYFTVETKSLLVAAIAVLAGVSVWMAVGPSCGELVRRRRGRRDGGGGYAPPR
eukprot:SAG22_NODE_497_length_9790_cov_3.684178_7_plen_419_part_00